MASGLTFPTLNPCISPYQLVVILNDFFLQIQTASTFNFDTYVNSGSFDGSQLTLTNNLGGTFNVPWREDVFVTAGTYDHSSSLITLDNSTGGTVTFSLSGITDQINSIQINSGNDFVTAGTYDYNSRKIDFIRQSGGTFSTSLSALTNDLYGLSAQTSFDVTTGASYNSGSQNIVFTTYTGGTYSTSLSALTGNRYVTGMTYNSGTTFLTLSNNSGDTYSTSLSALTNNDYVVSGTYSSGSSQLTLTTFSGNSVVVDMSELANQVNTDDYVVSGVFNSGTSVLTLTTLSGNTVEVTGVTQEDRYIFSGQVVGTSVMNFFGTDGYNFSVDVTSLSNAAQNISNAVYSADSSSIVFYSSSGGTAFVVDGISKITGGTYDSGVEQMYLYDSTGGTLTITGFTDNYITGGSFIASSTTIDLYDRSGNTVSIDATSLVSQDGVLAVSGGTNISTGGTQQYPIVSLNDIINLGTVNATNGNFSNLTSNSLVSNVVNTTNISTTTLNSTTGYFNVLSAETYYSGSTDLSDLIIAFGGGASTATTIQNGTNTTTGGTQTEPTVNVVDSPSFNNVSSSGLTTMNSASATTLSASTIWVTNMSGMSPVNINGVRIFDDNVISNSFSAAAGSNSTEFKISSGGDSRLVFSPDNQSQDFSIRYGSSESLSLLASYSGATTLYYQGVTRLTTSLAGGTLTGTWVAGTFNVTTDLTVNGDANLQRLIFTGTTAIIANIADTIPTQQDEYLEVPTITTGLIVNKLYYLTSGQTWAAADASSSGTSISLLGIPPYTSSAFGVLTKGYIPILTTDFNTAPTVGAPVYVSETAGRFSATPPTTSGAVARIIGYYVDAVTIGRNNYYTIFFNPSNDYIIIS